MKTRVFLLISSNFPQIDELQTSSRRNIEDRPAMQPQSLSSSSALVSHTEILEEILASVVCRPLLRSCRNESLCQFSSTTLETPSASKARLDEPATAVDDTSRLDSISSSILAGHQACSPAARLHISANHSGRLAMTQCPASTCSTTSKAVDLADLAAVSIWSTNSGVMDDLSRVQQTKVDGMCFHAA